MTGTRAGTTGATERKSASPPTSAASPRTAPRVGLALCDCLASEDSQFPLSLLQLALQTSLNAPVRSFRHGCSDLDALASWVGEKQLGRVLLVCASLPGAGDHDALALPAIRKAACEALRPVEVFALPLAACASSAGTDTEVRRALRVSTAAFRYLERRPPIPPEQQSLRPAALVASRLSRRQLFRRQPAEQPCVTPAVHHSRCAAVSGCRLCTAVCPTAALSVVDHRLQIDCGRCEGCGLCANACPRRALEQPDHNHAALSTQLRLLADSQTNGPEPLLLACPAASQRLEEAASAGETLPLALHHLALPCLRLLPAEWALQALSAGASRVLLSACDQRCRWYQPTPQPRHGLRLAWAVLHKAGGDESLVTEVDLLTDALGDSVESLRKLCEGEPLPASCDRQALELAAKRLARRGCLSPEALPGHSTQSGPLFSHVRVAADRCTVCGACAGACPAEALTLRETDEPARRLQFDATRCVGCDYCRVACPEQALTLGANADVEALLTASPATAARSELVPCRQCHRPFATLASQQRLRRLLGASGDTPLALNRLDMCPDCCARSLALEAVPA